VQKTEEKKTIRINKPINKKELIHIKQEDRISCPVFFYYIDKVFLERLYLDALPV